MNKSYLMLGKILGGIAIIAGFYAIMTLIVN
jgi:hypothetical protein